MLFASFFEFSSCKKDKFITDPNARVNFSQDSVLFDTVFTTIGSATKQIRVVNNNKQKIKISSIQLVKGTSSQFIINVDGAKGTSFSDLEIAAKDSMYIFIQVNVNPTGINSPAIINDEINFVVNEKTQTVKLEAWGQDAYYHHPDAALYFKDGSYLAYTTISTVTNATVTWPNDKPHVIYGYLVVDEYQKLIIQAGTKIYMNYKAGIWVYKRGEIQILGQKGNEVVIQGARREKDYADEPGQWDRIWINEGSEKNKIDYAIIKNGYIGVQAEVIDSATIKHRLTISNTKIQNMSLWGMYCLAFNISAGNNVISNCQEHSLHILLGGNYNFTHCTFANYWEKDKAREKPTIKINNFYDAIVVPLDTCNFRNCIIDGKLDNEIDLNLSYDDINYAPKHKFSDCYFKATTDVTDVNHFVNVFKGPSLNYEDYGQYNFKPTIDQTAVRNFTSITATNAASLYPQDINMVSRTTGSVTLGAYQVN
jgi:hypothetical protein